MARSVVEDDYHHFRVEVLHAHGRVTAVRSESPRYPYSLCPAAGSRLSELVDLPLTARMSDLTGSIDARLQCTHQFDIAALAVAAAARGTPERRYDAIVEDQIDRPRHASLKRDGVEVLAWDVEHRIIVAPEAVAGRGLGSGFTAHVAETLDSESAEAALVLRRAAFISSGRGMTDRLDAIDHAPPRSGCWVEQPQRSTLAKRIRGSTQDFTGRTEALTQDDEGWLAFEDLDRSF